MRILEQEARTHERLTNWHVHWTFQVEIIIQFSAKSCVFSRHRFYMWFSCPGNENHGSDQLTLHISWPKNDSNCTISTLYATNDKYMIEIKCNNQWRLRDPFEALSIQSSTHLMVLIQTLGSKMGLFVCIIIHRSWILRVVKNED